MIVKLLVNGLGDKSKEAVALSVLPLSILVNYLTSEVAFVIAFACIMRLT